MLATLVVVGFGLNSQASLTGTYSFPSTEPYFANSAVDNGNGTYELTSTGFNGGVVAFTLSQTVAFSQLTDLEAVFTAHTGGAYGGSPRFVLDLSNGGNINVLLGSSPSYTDSAASLNTYSGVNLIGNIDAGRYDTSNDGLAGGSPFTTYSAALAQAGSLNIVAISFAVDGGWGLNGHQDITLNSIDGAPVPEPTTMVAGALLLLPFGASTLRMLRKKRTA